MPLERFARQQASDDPQYDHTSLEDRIERVINPLLDKAHIDSDLLESANAGTIALTAGVENLIEHGLGKAARGWFLVDKDTPASVWRVTGTSEDATKYLVLDCTDDCNVKLVVF